MSCLCLMPPCGSETLGVQWRFCRPFIGSKGDLFVFSPLLKANVMYNETTHHIECFCVWLCEHGVLNNGFDEWLSHTGSPSSFISYLPLHPGMWVHVLFIWGGMGGREVCSHGQPFPAVTDLYDGGVHFVYNPMLGVDSCCYREEKGSAHSLFSIQVVLLTWEQLISLHLNQTNQWHELVCN